MSASASAVARALLANRPIMLFDEPTAHVDNATADVLAAEILAATAGRTALIVTHRPEQTPGLPRVVLVARPPAPHPAGDAGPGWSWSRPARRASFAAGRSART